MQSPKYRDVCIVCYHVKMHVCLDMYKIHVKNKNETFTFI